MTLIFSCALSIADFNYSNYSFSQLSLQDSPINTPRYENLFSKRPPTAVQYRDMWCDGLSSTEMLQLQYWRKFVKTIRGASGRLFSEQFLWWRAESTQNISKLSDKQQNIFRRRRNQRGSFLCGLGKVYSWAQILTGTNDCLQLTVQRIAVSQSWEWPSIQTFTACTIQINRPKPPKINIITESQRRAHIGEARTWKCFALLLRKWLKRLKKTVAD